MCQSHILIRVAKIFTDRKAQWEKLGGGKKSAANAIDVNDRVIIPDADWAAYRATAA